MYRPKLDLNIELYAMKMNLEQENWIMENDFFHYSNFR